MLDFFRYPLNLKKVFFCCNLIKFVLFLYKFVLYFTEEEEGVYMNFKQNEYNENKLNNRKTDDDYVAEKFRIIKDSLACLSFFQFYYDGEFYRADGLYKTVRIMHNGFEIKTVTTFKNYYDLLTLTFLDDMPFEKLVARDDFIITAM